MPYFSFLFPLEKEGKCHSCVGPYSYRSFPNSWPSLPNLDVSISMFLYPRFYIHMFPYPHVVFNQWEDSLKCWARHGSMMFTVLVRVCLKKPTTESSSPYTNTFSLHPETNWVSQHYWIRVSLWLPCLAGYCRSDVAHARRLAPLGHLNVSQPSDTLLCNVGDINTWLESNCLETSMLWGNQN